MKQTGEQEYSRTVRKLQDKKTQMRGISAALRYLESKGIKTHGVYNTATGGKYGK